MESGCLGKSYEGVLCWALVYLYIYILVPLCSLSRFYYSSSAAVNALYTLATLS